MKKLLLLLILASPTAAMAAEPNLDYSYVEGGYTHASLTGLNGGGDGFGLDGSANIASNFFLEAGLQGNAWDTHQENVEKLYAERDFLHAGWHVALTDDVDAVFRAGLTRVYVSSSEPGAVENSQGGYDAGLGLRARLPAGFELEAMVGADDAELVYSAPAGFLTAGAVADDRAERYANLTLRYHLTEHLLLGLGLTSRGGASPGYGNTADMNTWYLSARWNFSR